MRRRPFPGGSRRILSDALVRELIATGRADVLVGLPTLDNAATIGPVLRAIHALFRGPLARERTVLLACDGGSSDGTLDAVRGAGLAEGDLLTESHPLRTIHRIGVPYHGVPGRAGALQIVFAAADLLSVRAVLVLDPAARTTTDEMLSLLAPVRSSGGEAGAELVKPVLPRAPCDGPLITQLVRPLVRAAWGRGLLEPLDTRFACSGRFAAASLAQAPWDEPDVRDALDVWLATQAIPDRAELAQVAVASAPQPTAGRRPSLPQVFRQVVAALFACLSRDAARWSPIRGSVDVPIRGTTPPVDDAPTSLDASSYARDFRDGVRSLAPVLRSILDEALLAAVHHAAADPTPGLDAVTWARAVWAFVAAAHRHVLPRDELAQAMLPLYAGRLVAFLRAHRAAGSDAADAELVAVADAFESEKPTFEAHLRSGGSVGSAVAHDLQPEDARP